MTIDIPQEINEQLIRWAIWNRGHYIPGSFWVGCGSIESKHVGRAGKVHQSATEALEESTAGYKDKDDPRTVSDPEAVQTEITILRLPDKNRMALRLHYVAYKQIPVRQRCRMLGVGFEGYTELVKRSALMVRNGTKAPEGYL